MQWKKIFALYLFQYALPHIRKTSGCVINDSSLVGKLGQDGSVTYVATKVSLSHRALSGKCDCKLKLSIFKHIYQTLIKDECLAYFLRKCAKLDCDIIHAVFSFINQKAKITSMKHASTKSLVQNKAIWEVNMNWKTWLNMYLKYKLKKKSTKSPFAIPNLQTNCRPEQLFENWTVVWETSGQPTASNTAMRNST